MNSASKTVERRLYEAWRLDQAIKLSPDDVAELVTMDIHLQERMLRVMSGSIKREIPDDFGPDGMTADEIEALGPPD